MVHFFHHKFKRCEIMDKHIQKLAPKYFGTLFIRVFVENVPWLVERLGIKVLPCVITFMNGMSKDRHVLVLNPPAAAIILSFHAGSSVSKTWVAQTSSRRLRWNGSSLMAVSRFYPERISPTESGCRCCPEE